MLQKSDFINFMYMTENVYSCMRDDLSKKIYQYRLLYALTSDASQIKHMIDILPISFSWLNEIEEILLLNQNQGKPLILVGAGVVGRIMRYMFPMISWLCYCDQNSKPHKLDGLEVIERKRVVKEYPDALYAITTVKTEFYKKIESELLSYGIKNICNIGKRLNQSIYDYINLQYFEIFSLDCNEVFIDAGCYDCQTIFEFVHKSNGNYKKIYSFEPEPEFYKKCYDILEKSQIKFCELYNCGLWDQETTLHFTSNGDGSKIKEDGEHIIKVNALDRIFENKIDKPTFIKMDIEGAELNALQGASNIIKNYGPKLAISVYHKKEDILTIPSYILSINPNYKFKLRHYTACYGDTVLYGWVE